MSRYRLVPDWLRRLLTTPTAELTRWQFATRYFIELCRYGARQLKEDRAGQMAAALAFRTIFGLIPVVIIGLVLFRAFGGLPTIEAHLVEWLRGNGWDEVMLVDDGIADGRARDELKQDPDPLVTDTDEDPGATDANDPIADEDESTGDAESLDEGPALAAGTPDTSEDGNNEPGVDDVVTVASADSGRSIVDWVQDMLNQLDSELRFSTIGFVGVLVLAWASISLLTTIERCFNTVCDAPSHRPLRWRIPLYWLTITIGPALIYMSFSIGAGFDALVEQQGWSENVVAFIARVTSFGSTWLFLIVLYRFMPNAQVGLKAIAMGAFVASVLWTVITFVFGSYLSLAFTASKTISLLYGSLGFIPVFMIWMYILWLVILFGMEIAFTVHSFGMEDVHRPLLDRRSGSMMVEPLAVIPVLGVVGRLFAAGRRTSRHDIVDELGLADTFVQKILSLLSSRGILHRVSEDDGPPAYALARPAEQIPLSEVIQIAFDRFGGMPPMDDAARSLVDGIRRQTWEAAGDRTLADLLSEAGPLKSKRGAGSTPESTDPTAGPDAASPKPM